MRIAVDAMGGDHAPAAPVRGALQALAARPDLSVALVGRPDVVAPLVAGAPAPLRARCTMVGASEVVEPDEPPAAAVRRKRDSSVAVGLDLCSRGEAAALVSAGPTGALLAGCVLAWGCIPGVARPAMPVILPTVDARGCVFLDVGAHMEADARNLYDYAIMGTLYAQRARGVSRPRVGLLNVGTERGKGTGVIREAYALLQASGLDFAGNVEGRDLFDGACHVVVTDGFVGNVVIKAIEGVGRGISRVLGHELRHSGLWTLLGAWMVAGKLRSLRKRMDYAEYGGVPFLGVHGVCVKCHGSSDERALRNGVLAAARVVEGGVIDSIAAHMRELRSPAAPAGVDAGASAARQASARPPAPSAAGGGGGG